MGYSNESDMVRVDFFKESGKWYCTEAVRWTGAYDGILDYAFARTLVNHLRSGGKVRLSDMTAVCLEPFNTHPVPLMMTVKHAVAIVDGTAPKYQPIQGPAT